MKVALVYTSTTPELIELVEKDVGAVLPSDTEVVSYEDPSILAEVRDAGYVTAPAAARLDIKSHLQFHLYISVSDRYCCNSDARIHVLPRLSGFCFSNPKSENFV